MAHTMRGDEGGPWYVVDYDGNRLPGGWPTEDKTVDDGLCGRYLLSGMEVRSDTDQPDPNP